MATGQQLVDTGTLLDDGMIHFDARLSAHYPTLEVRIAGLRLHAYDVVVLAALAWGWWKP